MVSFLAQPAHAPGTQKTTAGSSIKDELRFAADTGNDTPSAGKINTFF
jgi:hypothetical protein